MVNGILSNIKREELNQGALEVNSVQALLNTYLIPNSVEDEVNELLREIAALKGKSVQDTLDEMRIGIEKYLQAINTPILFENNLPTDIDKYVNKLENLAQGIEICWDIFSLESRNFFIQLAYEFCQARFKIEGWTGIVIKLKLCLRSILNRENLFHKYKNSFLLIPKAVDKAIEDRKDKSTSQLSNTAQLLLTRIQKANLKQETVFPFLKYLGQNREDQIRKNQAAMAWAKRRLEEIEKTKK